MDPNSQNQQNSLLSLDEYLANEELYASEIPVQSTGKITYGTTKSGKKIVLKEEEVDEVADEVSLYAYDFKTTNSIEKGKTVTLNKVPKYGEVGTTSNALSRHAKEKLELYLKKSPQFKVLETQINILKGELVNYKIAGRDDLVEITTNLLNDLEATKNKFVKLYKNKNWKEDKVVNTEKIKNSDYLKELKEVRKDLENQYSLINPNSLIVKMANLRKMVLINFPDESDTERKNKIDYLEQLIEDIENENNDIEDFLDDEKSEKLNLKQEYANLCGHISEIVDLLPSEISNMNLNKLRKLLVLAIPETKIKELVDKIDNIKLTASNEIAKLKGNQDITNIMFEIFDFETVPEQQPKEMLAASNVEYVKGIAYNTCSRLNMMHNFDDATAYGLLGLSLAIDKWYKIQKLRDSAVSFNGFAHLYITNAIKKGMYELNSGGVINPSSMATLVTKYNQQMDSFKKNNPELKDLPKELIEGILDGLTDIVKPGTVVTESTYSDIIGGEGADADIWANVASSNMNDDKFIEAKLEYEELLKSIKALFNLFEIKVDQETGIREITKKKIFNKFDYKLFKLCYGIEFKREEINSGRNTVNNLYDQTEIADIMSAYYASFGATNRTFTQSAISSRIKTLNEKIKAAIDDNPVLKSGFEYMYNYMSANSDAMRLLTNSREEMDIKLEREELKEVYSADSVEMEKILSDGKKLNDVYQMSASNPLDEELADSFRNLQKN